MRRAFAWRRPTPLSALLRCARGTATIEFALCSLFLFGTIMVALDFGIYSQQKLKLGQAVEAGALIAYNQQVGAATSTISNYIQTYAGTKVAPTVLVTCNGSASAGDCASGRCSCLTAAGGFTAVGSCSSPKASCSSGGVEGNYMKIVATMTYDSVAVPDQYLGGKTITQSAVVRLQ